MPVTCRTAIPSDAETLHDLRRRSILKLAPKGMSVRRAREWAARGSVKSMHRRLEQTEAWVAEVEGEIVGWIAVRGDYVDGLYVDPGYTKRGIGAHLLRLVEGVLRGRGSQAIHADASWNSEGFYMRQGYEPLGPRPPNAARPMRKVLLNERAG